MVQHAGMARVAKRMTGGILAVGWFIVLFVLAICVATVTLSASQLQSRLLAFSRSDIPLSVWQVERIRASWKAQQAIISSHVANVAEKQKTWVAAEAETQKILQKLRVFEAKYQTDADALVIKVSLVDDLFKDTFDAAGGNQKHITLIKKAEAILVSLPEGESRTLLNDLSVSVKDSWNEIQSLSASVAGAMTTASNAMLEVEREQELLASAEQKLEQIVDPDKKLDLGDHQRIYDLISEFTFMEGFAFGALYTFSVLPNEFLIIVLVITMGVLGSTLQLTYLYYREGGIPGISLFFLRPMLGAITALVVFVLLKAGVLIVTDSAKLGEVAPLNPFFIAFVGIVSGLLSENALETVRRVGETWFKGSASDFAARWASGVKPLLSKTKTLESLSSITGIELAKLAAWVDEEERVPADMQKVIAAWLDKDVRTLFTDIPPPEAVT